MNVANPRTPSRAARSRRRSILFACALWLSLPVALHVSAATAQAAAAYQTYQYDSLGRLVGAWDSAGLDAQFAYDPAGNRTQTGVVSGPAPPAPPPPPPTPRVTGYEIIQIPGAGVVEPSPE